MCLQCETDAVSLKDDILPGFYFVQARKHHEDWPAGWYGLVECNDPAFIWEKKPLPEPKKETDGGVDEWMKWFDNVVSPTYDSFLESGSDILAYFRLVKACKKVGYDEEKDGFNIMCWLVNHLSKYAEVAQG